MITVRSLIALVVGFCILAVSPSGSHAQEGGEPVAIRAALLIDGTERAPIEGAVVIVRGDIIEAVASADIIRIPEDAEIIDLGDETLLPGLIDTHGHLSYRPGFAGKDLWEQIVEPAPQQLMRMLRNEPPRVFRRLF